MAEEEEEEEEEEEWEQVINALLFVLSQGGFFRMRGLLFGPDAGPAHRETFRTTQLKTKSKAHQSPIVCVQKGLGVVMCFFDYIFVSN